MENEEIVPTGLASGQSPQISQESLPQPTEPTKKKRVISPEAKAKMMENLAKAREARSQNRAANIKKYPVGKRQRALQMVNDDIEAKAEAKAAALAEKMLAEKERERELEELRRWKKEQEKLKQAEPQEEEITPKKKKAPAKSTAKKPASASSAAKKSTKPPVKRAKTSKAQLPESDEEDIHRQQSSNFNDYYGYGGGGLNIDDFLD